MNVNTNFISNIAISQELNAEALIMSSCFSEVSQKAGYLKLFGSKEMQDTLVCTRDKLDALYDNWQAQQKQ